MTRLNQDYPMIADSEALDKALTSFARVQKLSIDYWSQARWAEYDEAKTNHTLLMLSLCRERGIPVD
jgi:hypothetical protein